MEASDTSVFIQSVEGRPVWEQAQAAIEASDIGKNYTRLVHPPVRTYAEFVQDVFAEMAAAPTPYVLRFEDDVTSVNSHILHNIRTWPALDDPRFGVGWLFNPAGEWSERTTLERIYGEAGNDGWHLRGLVQSSAVVFRTADVPWLREHIGIWMQTHAYLDLALGAAMAERDRCVVVHAPALVDHDPSVPSHKNPGLGVGATAGGTFRQEWRRE